MSNVERKYKRQKAASQVNKNSKLYKAALKEGEKMEQHFKKTLNSLPWLKRQIIGYQVMRGTWK